MEIVEIKISKYGLEELKDYLVFLRLKLEYISQCASDASLALSQIKEPDDADDSARVAYATQLLDAVSYLAGSMEREVDLRFALQEAACVLIDIPRELEKCKLKGK